MTGQHRNLRSIVNLDAIQALTDGGSYIRGLNIPTDSIRIINESDDQISATIAGTDIYRTTLTVGDSGIQPFCSCPVDWAWCKHAVALAALVTNQGQPNQQAEPAPFVPPHDGPDPITAFLTSHDKDGLLLLIEHLALNIEGVLPELARLAVEQEDATGDPSSEIALIFEEARSTEREFNDYNHAPEVGWAWQEAIEQLFSYAEDGYGPHITPFLEGAIDHLYDVLGKSDDSDGTIGVAFTKAVHLHGQLAQNNDLNSPDLAGWLIKAFLDLGGYYTPQLLQYKGMLTKEDISRLHDVVHLRRALLAKNEDRFDYSSYALDELELELAKLSGEDEKIIGALIGQKNYTSLIAFYEDHGRTDEARALVDQARTPQSGVEIPTHIFKVKLAEYFGQQALTDYLEKQVQDSPTPWAFYDWLEAGAPHNKAMVLIKTIPEDFSLLPIYYFIVGAKFADPKAGKKALSIAKKLGQSPVENLHGTWAVKCAEAIIDKDPNLACDLYFAYLKDKLQITEQSRYYDAANTLAKLQRRFTDNPKAAKRLKKFILELRERYARRPKMQQIFTEHGLPE